VTAPLIDRYTILRTQSIFAWYAFHPHSRREEVLPNGNYSGFSPRPGSPEMVAVTTRKIHVPSKARAVE